MKKFISFVILIVMLSCQGKNNILFFNSSLQKKSCDTITSATDGMRHSYLIKCDTVKFHYLYFQDGSYDVFHKRLNGKTFLRQYFDSTGFLYLKDTFNIEGEEIYAVTYEKGGQVDTFFNEDLKVK